MRETAETEGFYGMIRILFVCHGNICRSTMAEFVMKDIVNKQEMLEEFHIESSATHTDEIWNGKGSPVYPPAVAKLREHGIGTRDNELGVSAKRARLTSRNDYDRFDIIIGMDNANIRNLNRIFGGDPDKKIFKMLDFTDRAGDVADPWYTGNFDDTWRDVSEGCHGLFRYILTDSKYVRLLDGADMSFGKRSSEDFDDTDSESTLIHDDFPRG